MNYELMQVIAMWTGVLLALSIAAYCLHALHQAQTKVTYYQAHVKRLRQEVQKLGSYINNHEAQISTIDSQLRQLGIQTEQLATTEASHESAYQYATHMVKMGASAEDLMQNCGLSRGEAELIVRLNN